MAKYNTHARRINIRNGGAMATTEQWVKLCNSRANRCLCCGQAQNISFLTRDHIIPISKPGSNNGIENLQPLCGWCNTHKSDLVIDFRSEKSSLLIHLLPDCLQEACYKKMGGKPPKSEAKADTKEGRRQKHLEALEEAIRDRDRRIELLHEKYTESQRQCKATEKSLLAHYTRFHSLPWPLRTLCACFGCNFKFIPHHLRPKVKKIRAYIALQRRKPFE